MPEAIDSAATVSAPIAAPAPVAAPATTTEAPAPVAQTVGDAPKTMADAIERSVAVARDELGRFARGEDPLKPVDPLAALADPTKPAEVVEPDKPEDLLKVPEGVGAKAKQRFENLARANRELNTRLEQAGAQVGYVQQAFQQHNVTQPQFEQALGFIGAVNKGDLRGALSILDAQRKHIALALGEPLAGVDALADHPDLRQQVDGFQLTEAGAMQVARARQTEEQLRHSLDTARQTQQSQQAEQQAFTAGQMAVDTWSKKTAATDLDFPQIEALLLPRVGDILADIPPQRWAAAMQRQYDILKASGAAFKRPADPTPAALRPNGLGSGGAQPNNMLEAIMAKLGTAA